MYWLYRTHVYTWRNQYVQAQLLTPLESFSTGGGSGYGFDNAQQDTPFGVELSLTYQIDRRHPCPDNYYETAGFSLYSERLVALMQRQGVKAEIFAARMVDKQGNEIPEPRYFVFHPLEGVLQAMDEARSGWTGSTRAGIPRLVLDMEKFEHRPIFKCNHIFVTLMRDDLKQAIREQGITGFDFLAPDRFHSGQYGARPEYED